MQEIDRPVLRFFAVVSIRPCDFDLDRPLVWDEQVWTSLCLYGPTILREGVEVSGDLFYELWFAKRPYSRLELSESGPCSVKSRKSHCDIQLRLPVVPYALVLRGLSCDLRPDTCDLPPYSHSIVPGGFEVTSYTTRFTPRTSFTIRFEIVFNTSYGSGTQSAVMPSSECTARIAQV